MSKAKKKVPEVGPTYKYEETLNSCRGWAEMYGYKFRIVQNRIEKSSFYGCPLRLVTISMAGLPRHYYGTGSMNKFEEYLNYLAARNSIFKSYRRPQRTKGRMVLRFTATEDELKSYKDNNHDTEDQ